MDFKKITKRVNWGLKGAFYELVGRELEKITNSWENKQDSEKVSTLLWYGLCTVVIIIVTIIIFIDWQITSLIRTSPESFNGSLLMMYF
ncbi:hypothetical protein [Levilactobacillus brevis]|uniref:hypothetical protein n=1 Tax=Levilactobacillus brevis TaxID=1580 RepID=UPI0021A78932|nr:hypothetical protein [Levilactobacillus brevis]MCT3569070.1 hypothetical protein [Levilactobacillus brevis]MCT3577598.1 hypothetical protein [Levilactobacillus brevis]